MPERESLRNVGGEREQQLNLEQRSKKNLNYATQRFMERKQFTSSRKSISFQVTVILMVTFATLQMNIEMPILNGALQEEV